MPNVTLTIDGKQTTVPAGTTILQAAKQIGVDIPTLCYLNIENANFECKPGSCRICVVEVQGARNLSPSCVTAVMEGMVVKTNSARATNARKKNLELLLSDHPNTCLTCSKSGNCELQHLTQVINVPYVETGAKRDPVTIDIGKALKRDMSKCIMCRRCETICTNMQSVNALSAVNRGFQSYVGTAFGEPLQSSVCVACGQCSAVCPVGAITEKDEVDRVLDALADPEKTVIFQTAPAVRVAIGEEFGMPAGTIATGKLVTALRRLGADYVFDTNFAADLTIMEESKEIAEHLMPYLEGKEARGPIATSCCSAWVNFFESQFPELMDLPSTSKSPQAMFGAVAKNYFADKIGVSRDNLVVVSIMPCIAKKVEANRDQLKTNLKPDVDIVLTTREAARLFRVSNIDFPHIEDSEFDNPLGESTGAGAIFGVTGGVLEAALRSIYEMVTKQTLEKVDFESVRGFDGMKRATITINEKDINVAIIHGLANVRKILEEIKNGNPRNLHVIEVMACPGGCISGGGQPYIHSDGSILEKRTQAIYEIDKNKTLRKSHENPFIQELYENYYGEPGSELAHKQLHTHYSKRKKY